MRSIYIQKPGTIKIVDGLKLPSLRRGEALLKVNYIGICGSDVSIYLGEMPMVVEFPRIIGHEISAEIMKIGKNKQGFRVGNLVTVLPYFNCKNFGQRLCPACAEGAINACINNKTMGVQRHGAASDYIAVPIENLVSGGDLSAKMLTLAEPFAVSYHAVKKARPRVGDNVLIIGAGPIGVAAMTVVKFFGAKVYIIDVNRRRLKLAKRLGADGVFNPNADDFEKFVKKATFGKGMDLCVEASGNSLAAINCVKALRQPNRTVVAIAHSKKPLNNFFQSELVKREGVYRGSRNSVLSDFLEVVKILSRRPDIEKMITKIYSVAEAPQAFKDLTNSDGKLHLKSLLKF